MNCSKCIYADVSSKERTIKYGNVTVTQKGNGVNCTCTHIKSISITGGNMICSAYTEKEVKYNE